MSSGNAFNQVKAILGKLDRSIDAARAQRLGEPQPGDENESGPARDKPMASHAAEPTERRERPSAEHQPPPAIARNGQPRPPGASPTTSNPQRRPGIGRAKPLARPSDDATRRPVGND